MFLVRTTRTTWSTASARDALAQAEALRKAGYAVMIERLGRRSFSLADLQRTITAEPRLAIERRRYLRS